MTVVDVELKDKGDHWIARADKGDRVVIVSASSRAKAIKAFKAKWAETCAVVHVEHALVEVDA